MHFNETYPKPLILCFLGVKKEASAMKWVIGEWELETLKNQFEYIYAAEKIC